MKKSFALKATLLSSFFFPAGIVLNAYASSDDAITISQKNRTYAPEAITIRAGESIRIINDDIFLHHAFVDNERMEYDSGPIEEGEARKISFPEKGEFNVECAIHPKMKLTVTVE